MAPIVHVVMFAFEPSADISTIKAACESMLALQQKCLHPTSNKPYLTSIVGGKENSPEEMALIAIQKGMTHIFVCHFDNEEDRQYYLYKDPVHDDFKNSLKGVVSNVQVVDFEEGVF